MVEILIFIIPAIIAIIVWFVALYLTYKAIKENNELLTQHLIN